MNIKMLEVGGKKVRGNRLEVEGEGGELFVFASNLKRSICGAILKP